MRVSFSGDDATAKLAALDKSQAIIEFKMDGHRPEWRADQPGWPATSQYCLVNYDPRCVKINCAI